jgi:putative selenate reductase
MHGCPPHEIEAICRYMLEVKSLNTFVKLNPTLLGFDRVREILDTCGFDYLRSSPSRLPTT